MFRELFSLRNSRKCLENFRKPCPHLAEIPELPRALVSTPRQADVFSRTSPSLPFLWAGPIQSASLPFPPFSPPPRKSLVSTHHPRRKAILRCGAKIPHASSSVARLIPRACSSNRSRWDNPAGSAESRQIPVTPSHMVEPPLLLVSSRFS